MSTSFNPLSIPFLKGTFQAGDTVFAWVQDATADTPEEWSLAQILSVDGPAKAHKYEVSITASGRTATLTHKQVAPLIFFYEEGGKSGWTGAKPKFIHCNSSKVPVQLSCSPMNKPFTITTLSLKDASGASLANKAYQLVPGIGSLRISL